VLAPWVCAIGAGSVTGVVTVAVVTGGLVMAVVQPV